MVDCIQVTGENFPLPAGAKRIKDPYEALASSIVGYDNYPKLKEKFKGNLSLARQILARGPEQNKSGFACVAAMLADAIDEPLELILNDKKPASLGSLLDCGTIIVRGNLGKETGHSMRGGYIFVDGDIEQIQNHHNGVIYVTGDVTELAQMYGGVLIVAGNIKTVNKCENLNTANAEKPSPFVFTTSPVWLFGTKGYYGQEPSSEQSFVLPENELKGWDPKDLESKALELCKRRLYRDLDGKRKTLDSIGTVGDVVNFKTQIDGFHYGHEAGSHR